MVKTPLTLLLELGHPIQTNHDHLHLMVAKKAAWLHLRIVDNILFQAEVLWIPLYDQWYGLHQHTGNLFNRNLRFVFVPCASKTRKKLRSVQKSIDLFCTLQTNVAHSNPNHSLRHIQSWTDFESVRSSTAIASRGTSSHGRSTSVSSRCPENDDKIIRRNSNDKYSHHTAGGPTNTSCRSTQTRLGSTSTSNATTCSPTNTRSSRALKQ